MGPLPIGVAVKDTLALEPHWSINGEDWNWLAVIEPAIHELAELLCQLLVLHAPIVSGQIPHEIHDFIMTS